MKKLGNYLILLALVLIILTTTITAEGNRIKVFINNATLADDLLFIKKDRVLVPIRSIAEELEIEIEYIEKTKTVNIRKDNILIEVTKDSDIAKVNNKEVKLDVKPFINKDRMFVPLRFVGENLAKDVFWDGERRTVSVHELARPTSPKDEANNKVYNKISEYVKEESKKAFSPYYELLDFQISDYKEEVVDGNIEATFLYKIISKNYDKDPDTVKYIKEAKESGNPNYKQMYDEYLQPREMNFHFRVVVDKDKMTLYSNISPVGTEWEETKMTDYILDK